MSNRLHKNFIGKDFLLQSDFAAILYYDYAKGLPIIDYHNHLSPQKIVGDYRFENLSEAWLAGDHYKWRAMRTMGVDERLITGNADDKDKFKAWARTVPFTIRNPLYHWTHLELERYFDVDELLTEENAETIYERANVLLDNETHSVRGLLRQQNVELACTTEDPLDSLEHHRNYVPQDNDPRMTMAFRPDKSYAVGNAETYVAYVEKLGEGSGIGIKSYSDLLEALGRRIAFFHENGCRIADHGINCIPRSQQRKNLDTDSIFSKVMEHKTISNEEEAHFMLETLIFLAKEYHSRNWVQQFHLGALRNTNARMLRNLGPDTGFDSIGDFSQANALSEFMDRLNNTDQLTKTIIYNLNPSDNEVIASLIGSFNDGKIKGKIQFGSGWWFLDQKDGMERQMNALSNMGLFSCFVGMLTDSRSFLSFPRHEYFRRLVCNIIGEDVEQGLLPKDDKWLGKIVGDICYYNAKEYFNF